LYSKLKAGQTATVTETFTRYVTDGLFYKTAAWIFFKVLFDKRWMIVFISGRGKSFLQPSTNATKTT
jgi:hypothetical protein